MSKEKIETRKDEIRFMTNDPKEMIGKYTAERILKGWTEDFVDEDTSEVVTIERHEVLFDRGVLIDNEMASSIMFYIQSGDVSLVNVTNQCRLAFLQTRNYLFPWLATINTDGKKKKFLLYASSIEMVLEVVKDYVELNFSQAFLICQVKEFDSCIILKDTLKKYKVDEDLDLENIEVVDEEEDVTGKFYQLDVNVVIDECAHLQTFVVETKDVDKAMIVIKDYLDKKFTEEKHEYEKLEVKIETVKILPCDSFIDKDFSLAYSEAEKYV